MADPTSNVQLSVALNSLGTQGGFNSFVVNIISSMVFAAVGWGVSRILSRIMPKPTTPPKTVETGWTWLGYGIGFLTALAVIPFIMVWLQGEKAVKALDSLAIVSAAYLPTLIWLRNGQAAKWVTDDRRFLGAYFLSFTALLPASFMAGAAVELLALALRIDQYVDSLFRGLLG